MWSIWEKSNTPDRKVRGYLRTWLTAVHDAVCSPAASGRGVQAVAYGVEILGILRLSRQFHASTQVMGRKEVVKVTWRILMWLKTCI